MTRVCIADCVPELSRRAFLRQGTVVGASAAVAGCQALGDECATADKELVVSNLDEMPHTVSVTVTHDSSLIQQNQDTVLSETVSLEFAKPDNVYTWQALEFETCKNRTQYVTASTDDGATATAEFTQINDHRIGDVSTSNGSQFGDSWMPKSTPTDH